MFSPLGCLFTTMPATSGCVTSLRKLATLSVVVGALCRLVSDAANPTCNAGFDWAFNSLKQSPCDVTAALGGVCNGGSFSLASLAPTQHYAGPAAGFETPCRCNTVYYSTLNACALCQGASINPSACFSEGMVHKANLINLDAYYNTNCTCVYTQLFPSPIPSGFNVPHWAYLDVTVANTFDPTLAQAVGGSDSTALPQATGPTTPTPSPKKKANARAIAGGVVGGIVGLTLIAGLVFWLLRRRQNTSSQPTPGTYDPQPLTSYEKLVTGTGNAYTASVSTPPPKLYDPNDPTTFPANAAQNYTGTTNTLSAPQQPLYPNRLNLPRNPQMPLGPGSHNQYTGVPEL